MNRAIAAFAFLVGLAAIAPIASDLLPQRAAVAQTPAAQKSEQTVVARINGPTQSELGDLVVLDATGSTNADVFVWTLATGNKTFLPVEGGSKVVFASGTPGAYKFVLSAAGLTAEKKAALSVAVHVVEIGTPTPIPPGPVPPGPTPPPPDVPDGEHGLTKLAYESAMKVDSSARGLAGKIGDNWKAVGAALAAGGYLNVGLAKADLQARNSQAVGAQRDAWLNPFFIPVGNKLSDLEGSGKLSDEQTYSRALSAVGDGLKLVK